MSDNTKKTASRLVRAFSAFGIASTALIFSSASASANPLEDFFNFITHGTTAKATTQQAPHAKKHVRVTRNHKASKARATVQHRNKAKFEVVDTDQNVHVAIRSTAEPTKFEVVTVEQKDGLAHINNSTTNAAVFDTVTGDISGSVRYKNLTGKVKLSNDQLTVKWNHATRKNAAARINAEANVKSALLDVKGALYNYVSLLDSTEVVSSQAEQTQTNARHADQSLEQSKAPKAETDQTARQKFDSTFSNIKQSIAAQKKNADKLSSADKAVKAPSTTEVTQPAAAQLANTARENIVSNGAQLVAPYPSSATNTNVNFDANYINKKLATLDAAAPKSAKAEVHTADAHSYVADVTNFADAGLKKVDHAFNEAKHSVYAELHNILAYISADASEVGHNISNAMPSLENMPSMQAQDPFQLAALGLLGFGGLGFAFRRRIGAGMGRIGARLRSRVNVKGLNENIAHNAAYTYEASAPADEAYASSLNYTQSIYAPGMKEVRNTLSSSTKSGVTIKAQPQAVVVAYGADEDHDVSPLTQPVQPTARSASEIGQLALNAIADALKPVSTPSITDTVTGPMSFGEVTDRIGLGKPKAASGTQRQSVPEQVRAEAQKPMRPVHYTPRGTIPLRRPAPHITTDNWGREIARRVAAILVIT